MKKILLITWIVIASVVTRSYGECGQISMIGEFSNWSEDYFMAVDPVIPDAFYVLITFTMAQDVNSDGFIELKFRQDASWEINWGSQDFPEGTGVQDGPNILAPYGSYYVTFNCSSGHYNFSAVSGDISLIGEFNDYMGDLFMIRDSVNHNYFTLPVTFTVDDDPNLNGFVDIKFRENGDWTNNWGGTEFPQGFGILNGPVLPVPYGSYIVSFNRVSQAYNFEISIGIEKTNRMEEEISVYPNPASKGLYFRLDNPSKGNTCKISLLDLAGHVILDEMQALREGERIIYLDVSHCKPGFYSYRITANGYTATGKLILMPTLPGTI
jgi:hypothetical protein